MIELTVKGKKHLLLDKQDKCPICDAPRDTMRFYDSENFHGEAESSCCGAIYQLKDYYIENPTDEEKKLLELLADDYIEFSISPDWIEPLKQALRETGAYNINGYGVVDVANRLMKLRI